MRTNVIIKICAQTLLVFLKKKDKNKKDNKDKNMDTKLAQRTVAWQR